MEDPITSKVDLAGVLEFLGNGKTQSSESEKSSTKRLPVEKTTGSFKDMKKNKRKKGFLVLAHS